MRSSARSLFGALAVAALANPGVADPEPATEYVIPMPVLIDRDVAAHFSPSNLDALFGSGPTDAWHAGIQGTLPTRGAHCPLRYTVGDVRIVEPSAQPYPSRSNRLLGFANQR